MVSIRIHLPRRFVQIECASIQQTPLYRWQAKEFRARTMAGTAAGWTNDVIRALIAIWGESSVQEKLDSVKCNKAIYEEEQRSLMHRGSFTRGTNIIQRSKTWLRSIERYNECWIMVCVIRFPGRLMTRTGKQKTNKLYVLSLKKLMPFWLHWRATS